ncbi:MAG TPA: FoF1 ATP synthase subunit gamma [Terriglobales bacterium]|jgi:F-type H+-transporting ATPase subunit gamma|nr:FoF1 ATP synthase subunit gamma [Terriglobales bacterium]
MAGILDIRRRIRSVRNTRQITRAMKMISAARLRRAQERALSARPYAQMLTNVLKSLVMRAEIYDPETGEPHHPLLAQRPENTILLIVVTGDKGLAGAFNANILKAAMRFIQAKQGKNIDIETVGRKARDFFRRRFPVAPVEQPEISEATEERLAPAPRAESRSGAVQIVGEHIGILGRLEFAQGKALGQSVIERYKRCEIDAVYVLYNEFKSVVSQRVVVDEVLPIAQIGASGVRQAEELAEQEKVRMAEAAKSAGVTISEADTKAIDERAVAFAAAPVDYIYEQPPQELFNSMLPRYVELRVFHTLLESVAAEHAARMTAMDAATNNASEMIDALTLAMNRARQAKITKEIIEIVSGAAAL